MKYQQKERKLLKAKNLNFNFYFDLDSKLCV